MAHSYVLNPLRVRRGNVFWFQVAPQRALEIDNLPLIAALEDCLAERKSASSSALVECLGRAFPTTRKRQRRTTVNRLFDQRLLLGAEEATDFPKRVLAPALDRAIEELDRQRRTSYDAERAARDEDVLWESSIFGPLSLDRCVFYSALLIAATARGYDYELRYESKSRLKMKIAKDGMETEIDSRFRYLPEDPRAEALVETKSYANYLCLLAGIPVPRQKPVGRTVASACRAATALGYPVVVKPNHGHDGIDVHAHIEAESDLQRVLRRLLPKWKDRGGIVLEEHVPGTLHRLTVVGSSVVEVRAAHPPVVIGDGRSDLRALVRRENRLRKSTFTREDGGAGIRIDDRVRERLRRRGLSPKSILPRGEKLQLHHTLNRSAGVRSQAIEIEAVHPGVRTVAVKAVQLFGLSVGGVDYIAPTLDRPPEACNGKICEVQAHPAIIPGDLDYDEFVGRVLEVAMSRAQTRRSSV